MRVEFIKEIYETNIFYHPKSLRLFIKLLLKHHEIRIGILPDQRISKKRGGSIFFYKKDINEIETGNTFNQIRILWFAIAWMEIK